MEFKSTTSYTKEITGRTIVGLANVFGIYDVVQDRTMPGSFRKTIKIGRAHV